MRRDRTARNVRNGFAGKQTPSSWEQGPRPTRSGRAFRSRTDELASRSIVAESLRTSQSIALVSQCGKSVECVDGAIVEASKVRHDEVSRGAKSKLPVRPLTLRFTWGGKRNRRTNQSWLRA